jgi:hypothetical protein
MPVGAADSTFTISVKIKGLKKPSTSINRPPGDAKVLTKP